MLVPLEYHIRTDGFVRKRKTSQHILVIGPPCKRKLLHQWTKLPGERNDFTCTKCIKSYPINISAFIWFTAWFVELMRILSTSVLSVSATAIYPLMADLYCRLESITWHVAWWNFLRLFVIGKVGPVRKWLKL